MKSIYALDYMIKNYDFKNVLDIGCGTAEVANILEKEGKSVATCDILPLDRSNHYQGDFMKQLPLMLLPFDAIWCAHFLEHQPNVHEFLVRVKALVSEGGVVCLSVPPLKHEIVGGHLTLWNGGLLLYNLVRAGFDCSEARIKEQGYNISIILKVNKIQLPTLKNDEGDIETLAQFFPPSCRFQAFNGNIKELNW